MTCGPAMLNHPMFWDIREERPAEKADILAADAGGRETFFVEPCGDYGGLEHLVDVT